MSSPAKKGGSLDKWIVRKHGKLKQGRPSLSKTLHNNKYQVTQTQLDPRIKLRRPKKKKNTTINITRHHNST